MNPDPVQALLIAEIGAGGAIAGVLLTSLVNFGIWSLNGRRERSKWAQEQAREHEKWLRDKKYEVYTELVFNAEKFSRVLARAVHTRSKDHLDETRKHLNSIVVGSFGLLAPKDVQDTLRTWLIEIDGLTDASLAALRKPDGSSEREHFDSRLPKVNKAFDAVQAAMKLDLGS